MGNLEREKYKNGIFQRKEENVNFKCCGTWRYADPA
jgi:hypothetical protein